MFQSLKQNRVGIILEIRCTVQDASASSDTFFVTFVMYYISCFSYNRAYFMFQSLKQNWVGIILEIRCTNQDALASSNTFFGILAML